MRMQFFKRAGFAIFVFFSFFLSCETAIRFLGKNNYIEIENRTPPNRWGEASFLLGNYLLKPGAVRAECNVNQYGFSSPPFSKTPASYRIVTMGESSTYGDYASFEYTYPRLLGKILRINHGKDVEVINAGIPGHHSSQGLNLLERVVLPLKPNLIILQFAYNDFYHDAVSYSPNFFRMQLLNYYLGSSYFYRFMRKFVPDFSFSLNPLDQGNSFKEKIFQRKRETLKKNLKKMISLAQDKNVEVILNIPHLRNLEDIEYDNIAYKDELLFHCKSKYGENCLDEGLYSKYKPELLRDFKKNKKILIDEISQYKKIIIDLSQKYNVPVFYPPGAHQEQSINPDDKNFFFADGFGGEPVCNCDHIHPNRDGFLLWAFSLARIIAPKLKNNPLTPPKFTSSDGNTAGDTHVQDPFKSIGESISQTDDFEKIIENYYFSDYTCSRALISREFEKADNCYKYFYKKLADNGLGKYSKLLLANWGICKLMIGDTEEALKLLKKGLEIDPRDALLNYLYGSILLKERNSPTSIKYFENCLSDKRRDNIHVFHCLYGIAMAYDYSFQKWMNVSDFFSNHPKLHNSEEYDLISAITNRKLLFCSKNAKEREISMYIGSKRMERLSSQKKVQGDFIVEDRFQVGRYNFLKTKTFSEMSAIVEELNTGKREIQYLFNPPICNSEYAKHQYARDYGLFDFTQMIAQQN